MRLCLCVFVYLSGIYSTKSTVFSQSWNAFSSSSSNSVCMHVFVCRLFVRRLATETFSSLRTKLHSGYWLSRQPQSLSGTGSVFTLTYTLAQTHTHTHTNWGEPQILWRMRLFLALLGTRLLWGDPTARLKENPRPSSLCVQNSNDFIIGAYEWGWFSNLLPIHF